MSQAARARRKSKPRPEKLANLKAAHLVNGKRKEDNRRRFQMRSALAARIVSGEEDLSKWTTNELLTAKNMKIVPLQIYQELTRRVMSKAQFRFAAELKYAIDVHMEILKDPDAGPRNRLKAIEMIYERVLGAPDQKVDMHVTVDAPWQKMMADAVVSEKELKNKKSLPAKGVKRRAPVDDGAEE